MKKISLLLLLLLLAASALFSCQIGSGDSGGGTGGENQEGNGGEEDQDDPTDTGGHTVWSPGSSVQIIVRPDEDWDYYGFANTVASINGGSADVGSDVYEIAEHEIVVGDVNREISASAYKRLERLLDDEEGMTGWVIFARDGSLAVAYDSEYAFSDAIEYFRTDLSDKSTLTAKNGVFASGKFNKVTRISEIRAAKREENFNALIPTLGQETVDALRQLYGLYDDDIYVWMANLYDPSICVCDTEECQKTASCGGGGFYFSNSGRNNVGFLPDIESTVQVLNHLRSGGLFVDYENDYTKALPDSMQQQLLAFAKGLQSAEDGYFYHPQWGTDIIAARRGRDLGWATQLIKNLGGQPTYDAPDGTKGELGAPGGATAVSLTGQLGISSVAAVNKAMSGIMATSTSNLPKYLQSIDAWKEYIVSLDIPNDSYTAGNTLAAQHGQISLAGKEYEDVLIAYLNEHQYEHNGLWHPVTDYNTVNGLMKLASVYNYFNATIPNAEAALTSCMTVALWPDGDTHVCSVYNPWVTMQLLLASIENSDGEERVNELRALVLENAADLVRTTFNKISKYYVDGGFHYHSTIITHYSQKARVACSDVFEADVNATAISSTGITRNIFQVFGVDYVNLYYSDDFKYFMEIINGLDPVIKNKYDDEVETQTFDGYSSADGDEKSGLSVYPAANAQNVIREENMALDKNGNYKYYRAAVVDDPFPSNKNDKALKINTFVYKKEDGTSDVPTAAMSTYFTMENAFIIGDTYILDTDMLVNSGNGTFQQIFFTQSVENPSHSLSLNLSIYTKGDKQYIKISDNYAGPDGERDTNIVDGIPAGEWFNLRVEVYKIFSESSSGSGTKKLEIIAKIFVNGEYVGKSMASYTSNANPETVVDKNIGAVIFSHYRFSQTEVYFDNVKVERSNAKYEAQTVPIDPADIPSEVPTPAGESVGGEYFNNPDSIGKKYDFSDIEKPPALSNSMSAKTYITEDKKIFFWRLDDVIHEATTHLGVAPGEDVENPVYVTEMDVAFGGIAANTNYFYLMMIYGGGKRASAYMSTDSNGDIVFENVVEDSKYVPMKQNTWYNIRYELYHVSDTMARIKVYINGEYAVELNGVDFKDGTGTQVYNQLQSTSATAWMLFDNVYVGYDSIAFEPAKEAPPAYLPDISDQAGVKGSGVYYNGSAAGDRVDYDNGEMKPVPITGGTSSGIYITDDKYVYYYRKDTAAYTALRYDITDTTVPSVDNTLAAIIEMDVAFGNVTASYFSVIGFYGNGIRVNLFLSADSSGKIVFPHEHSSSDFKGFEQDTWYNLRLEMYYLDDGSVMIRVYVNGEHAAYVPGQDISSNGGNYIALQMQKTDGAAWMAYDNLYYGYADLVYEAPAGTTAPDTGDGKEDEDTDSRVDDPEVTGTNGQGVYYNNPDLDGVKYEWTSESATPPTLAGNGYTATVSLTKGGSALFDKNGSTLSQEHIRFNFGTKPEGYESLISVFEFDAAFGGVSASNPYVLGVYVGGMSANIFVTVDSDMNLVFSNVAAGTQQPMAQNTWYNIRIEAYDNSTAQTDKSSGNNLDAGSVMFKIYINGEYAVDLNGVDCRGRGSDTERALIGIQKTNTDAWVLVNNVYLGYEDKAFAAGDPDGDTTDPGEGEGGDTTDPDPNPGEGEGGETTDPDPDPTPDPDDGETLGSGSTSNSDKENGWTDL